MTDAAAVYDSAWSRCLCILNSLHLSCTVLNRLEAQFRIYDKAIVLHRRASLSPGAADDTVVHRPVPPHGDIFSPITNLVYCCRPVWPEQYGEQNDIVMSHPNTDLVCPEVASIQSHASKTEFVLRKT